MPRTFRRLLGPRMYSSFLLTASFITSRIVEMVSGLEPSLRLIHSSLVYSPFLPFFKS